MNYDFALENKGYLKIEGTLTEPDSLELQELLLVSLEKCQSLELNIDDITSIAPPCKQVLVQASSIAKQRRKSLTLSTRYQREAMRRWIKDMSASFNES
jgi:hypothetical protein